MGMWQVKLSCWKIENSLSAHKNGSVALVQCIVLKHVSDKKMLPQQQQLHTEGESIHSSILIFIIIYPLSADPSSFNSSRPVQLIWRLYTKGTRSTCLKWLHLTASHASYPHPNCFNHVTSEKTVIKYPVPRPIYLLNKLQQHNPLNTRYQIGPLLYTHIMSDIQIRCERASVWVE